MDFTNEYKQFIAAWGEDAQTKMCVEEMAELTKEICKFERIKQTDGTNHEKIAQVRKDLISEIADVLNTVEQLRLIFGAKEVDKIRQEKLDRQLKRLKD